MGKRFSAEVPQGTKNAYPEGILEDEVNLRWCSKCQDVLPITSFFKNKRNVDGMDYVCKDHNQEWKRDPKNLDRLRRQARLRYARLSKERKKRLVAQRKAWNKENPEKVKEYDRRYREKRRQRFIDGGRESD